MCLCLIQLEMFVPLVAKPIEDLQLSPSDAYWFFIQNKTKNTKQNKYKNGDKHACKE